ncbi:acyl-CoA thioesterase [Dankookia rubra]|uniref:Acyl-CoA thioesterase n=1 Tax=Dankookia rubra TaxID=1442381 RepID=A0A4R5Q7G0_9PROT|nr:acyl-CoA thioesterase [Dankookia rubra]TDH58830.1 acyl-CoA thioesterase [Dankookia rubra]
MNLFTRRIRVHWGDCDPARIAFHPNFIRWMDEGFTEMALARGIDFAALQREDALFRGAPLVDVRCGFRAPARYGQVLGQEVAPPVFSGRSFRIVHRFVLPDGRLAAEGEQVRIWGREVDGVLRAVPMPDTVCAAFAG